MKIAILGDLHIGVKNASELMMEHQNTFFEFFLNYCVENNITTIFQLGDSWDTRRNCNFKTLNFAYENLFDRIEDLGLHYHTVIGNHDIFYKETLDITSSDLLLRNYKSVTIYDKPQTIEFDGIKFDMIPWICNDNAEQCFEYIKNSNSDYCIGHFAINEFPMLGNNLFDGGINHDIFDHYIHVFSGHFHNRSQKYNITYVGVPYQLTWSDAMTKNGFIVFDTETRSWEYVENDDRYYFYVTYDDSKPGLSTNLETIKIKNSFIKVIVVNKKKPFLFTNYINKIIENSPADLKIIDQQLLDIQSSQIAAPQGQIKGTLQLINDYVDGLDTIDHDRKEQLKQTLTNLYNEAIMIEDDINADH